MTKYQYDQNLIRWAREHDWDGMDSIMILSHILRFVGEIPEPDVCGCFNPLIAKKLICTKCLKDMR